MVCAYISPPACAEHNAGPYHPERGPRLAAVHEALATAGLLDPSAQPATQPASLEALCRAHDRDYVSNIARAAPRQGRIALDPDTAMGPGSLDAALAAAGAALGAVDLVLGNGGVDRAFCNIRPPGHHAEHDRAMGFCLFNNAALAALRALDEFNLDRVAILDFDVHHGNGTEDIVRADRRILYASSFQYPLYPFPSLEGVPGHLVKTPLASGTGGSGFRSAIERDWAPDLARFAPQLVVFSAGFDAHRADPLASLELEAEDFTWVTRWVIAAVGNRVPIVSVLEGGYDLEALGACAAAHVGALAQG